MSSIDVTRSRQTGQIGTGGLSRSRAVEASSPAQESNATTRTQRRDEQNANAREAAKAGIEGMLGSLASEMADSDNKAVKATGEVLQLVLDSKAQIGNAAELKELLQEKGISPSEVKALDKAGVIGRAFSVAQGALAAGKFLSLAKEAASNPSKLKDAEFTGALMGQMGKVTQGVLSAMELISKTPMASKIPGIAGLIGGVGAIVSDIGSMKDGASASEIVSLIGNATGTLSNAMLVVAPATGGTSAVVAAGLKGVSLAMDGVGFVLNNSEKIENLGKKAWNWITGKS